MLVRISHRIVHEFAVPARGVTQILRLTPRNHEGQRIAYWRIDADLDCALRAAEDAFGNITHACTAAGPMNQFAISIDGEIFQDPGHVPLTPETEIYLIPKIGGG